MTFRIQGRKKVPIPEGSRFDRLSAEDLYLSIESCLSMATHQVDVYRGNPAERETALVQLQTALEDCLASTKALRRKFLPPSMTVVT